jgi:hypothetical protein
MQRGESFTSQMERRPGVRTRSMGPDLREALLRGKRRRHVEHSMSVESGQSNSNDRHRSSNSNRDDYPPDWHSGGFVPFNSIPNAESPIYPDPEDIVPLGHPGQDQDRALPDPRPEREPDPGLGIPYYPETYLNPLHPPGLNPGQPINPLARPGQDQDQAPSGPRPEPEPFPNSGDEPMVADSNSGDEPEPNPLPNSGDESDIGELWRRIRLALDRVQADDLELTPAEEKEIRDIMVRLNTPNTLEVNQEIKRNIKERIALCSPRIQALTKEEASAGITSGWQHMMGQMFPSKNTCYGLAGVAAVAAVGFALSGEAKEKRNADLDVWFEIFGGDLVEEQIAETFIAYTRLLWNDSTKKNNVSYNVHMVGVNESCWAQKKPTRFPTMEEVSTRVPRHYHKLIRVMDLQELQWFDKHFAKQYTDVTKPKLKELEIMHRTAKAKAKQALDDQNNIAKPIVGVGIVGLLGVAAAKGMGPSVSDLIGHCIQYRNYFSHEDPVPAQPGRLEIAQRNATGGSVTVETIDGIVHMAVRLLELFTDAETVEYMFTEMDPFYRDAASGFDLGGPESYKRLHFLPVGESGSDADTLDYTRRNGYLDDIPDTYEFGLQPHVYGQNSDTVPNNPPPFSPPSQYHSPGPDRSNLSRFSWRFDPTTVVAGAVTAGLLVVGACHVAGKLAGAHDEMLGGNGHYNHKMADMFVSELVAWDKKWEVQAKHLEREGQQRVRYEKDSGLFNNRYTYEKISGKYHIGGISNKLDADLHFDKEDDAKKYITSTLKRYDWKFDEKELIFNKIEKMNFTKSGSTYRITIPKSVWLSWKNWFFSEVLLESYRVGYNELTSHGHSHSAATHEMETRVKNLLEDCPPDVEKLIQNWIKE